MENKKLLCLKDFKWGINYESVEFNKGDSFDYDKYPNAVIKEMIQHKYVEEIFAVNMEKESVSTEDIDLEGDRSMENKDAPLKGKDDLIKENKAFDAPKENKTNGRNKKKNKRR